MENKKRTLSLEESKKLIETLKLRFINNINYHKDLEWEKIQTKLESNKEKLWSLYEMERTGGEPELIGYDQITKEYIFFDCSAESPIGRRNVCYDQEALERRKKNKPENSAIGMAEDMGIEILTKGQYEELQKLGSFDLKTSSWIKTPDKIRKLGGAIFCDYRYETVFLYHNGADSYYSSRGFRGSLKI